MAKILVDDDEIEVPDHYTLLQACEAAGREVPRFCYHERLSIAGNCRMCLVEVKGAPKPVASCAQSVRDLRPGPNGELPQVVTKSDGVKKARQGVMEFLLINHPLDCPICDQGGECDLQDQAMAYGVSGSRFHENKRAVNDKEIGPLIKTIMTRCIHCTRCVRFMTEVAGVSELGAVNRGEEMEITTYLEENLTSELQGNVIDLCPVGALTSKPYAFQARPWELDKTESVDIMDAVGSRIRVDSRGGEVLRIMPLENEAVNEEWISDKSRFIWDGLKSQRIDRPYVRKVKNLNEASWQEAFEVIKRQFEIAGASKTAVLAGDLISVEEAFAAKKLFDGLGVKNIDCRPPNLTALNPKNGRASYLFNPTIAGVEEVDAILMIGVDPRAEAVLLNTRIRKNWLNSDVAIGLIGESVDLTYPYEYLGASPEDLEKLLDGKNSFTKKLKAASKPLIIIGEGALARTDGEAVYNVALQLADKVGAFVAGKASADENAEVEVWNGFGVLHSAAGRVGALDVGFVPNDEGGKAGLDTAKILKGVQKGDVELLFAFGVDEYEIPEGGFVVYVGSHGDKGAQRADVVLPSAAYTEQNGTYVNLEGRVQETHRAVAPKGLAKEGWAIIRALSDYLNGGVKWRNFNELRADIKSNYEHFSAVNAIMINVENEKASIKFDKDYGKLNKAGFKSIVEEFYHSNPIARASRVMASCIEVREESKANKQKKSSAA